MRQITPQRLKTLESNKSTWCDKVILLSKIIPRYLKKSTFPTILPIYSVFRYVERKSTFNQKLPSTFFVLFNNLKPVFV